MTEQCTAKSEQLKEPQMTTQLQALHDTICFLEENVNNLETALIKISLQEVPEEKDSLMPPSPELVPMADELYRHRTRINRINDRLNSLPQSVQHLFHDRIEI